jgi:hypothetical protein
MAAVSGWECGRGYAEPSNIFGIMTLDLVHQGKTLVLHRLAVRREILARSYAGMPNAI